MEVKLNDELVIKIKDALTWGDKEKIKVAMYSGAKVNGTTKDDIGVSFDTSGLLEAKYVTLECLVVDVIEKGKSRKFTREFMDNLSPEDGDKLMNEVDKLQLKKNVQNSTE